MSKNSRILVVDDEEEMLSGCAKILKALGHHPLLAQNGHDAISLLQEEEMDLILCDLLMPDIDGMDILRSAQKYKPATPVIIFTAYGTIDRAVSAMKEGAFDFIEKPFEVNYLKVVIAKGLNQRNLFIERKNLLSQLKDRFSFDNIVGKSSAMRSVFEMIESVAQSESNVLITGESGTGKELIARSIHARSLRKTKAFVPVNCGAFPENLFEAEIFGYEKGAFTGAIHQKIGLLEFADGGTFFLDEVCEFPLTLQTKLLRVLQDKQLRRIGGNELIQINVRLISATNRNVQEALSNGQIRDDFYYRLNVINIHLPPLRDRKDDIPLLAEHFLQKILKSSPKMIKGFNDEVIAIFSKYHWPGNVRELENIVERAVTLSREEYITVDELPPELQLNGNSNLSFSDLTLTEVKQHAVERLEKKYLLFQLQKHQGNVTKIANEAGMTRRNIHRLLKIHNLDPKAWR
ncbi:MAG: sigma-54-dependent Fis family transcriptional regulator [bacterium]|nr:MAG: sigma-54-dependent Fis family transcriptional regulator [bacterium]